MWIFFQFFFTLISSIIFALTIFPNMAHILIWVGQWPPLDLDLINNSYHIRLNPKGWKILKKPQIQINSPIKTYPKYFILCSQKDFKFFWQDFFANLTFQTRNPHVNFMRIFWKNIFLDFFTGLGLFWVENLLL